MAENKAKAAPDAGQSEAEDRYNEAAKKGYFGQVPDGPPNSAFSMESGPDSPSPLEQHIAIHEARADELNASTAAGAAKKGAKS